MILTSTSIKTAASEAAYARDNLTYIDKDGLHRSKVCCICDKLIRYPDERRLYLEEDLKHVDVRFLFLDKNIEWSHNEISVRTKNKLLKYYKQQCYNINQSKYKFLKNYVLSPSSYPVNYGKKEGLGCCKKCRDHINTLKRKDTITRTPPTYSIVNGLMIGKPPEELACLTEVELAYISLGRIDKHIFSFSAGHHKMIQGWHSMYYNDVEKAYDVANWCDRNMEHDSDDDTFDDSHCDSIDTSSDGSECSVGDLLSEHTHENRESSSTNHSKKFRKIAVVLAGPFTQRQKAIVYKQCNVRWGYIKAALKWLKTWNIHYKNFDFDDKKLFDPIIVDKSSETSSSNNNIEDVFELHCVFPDSAYHNESNGGCNTRDDFKNITLDRLLSDKDNLEATLIGRPTTNILRDYEGDNLVKAFPLQFPYGIGGLNREGDAHGGLGYQKYLLSLSQPNFHRPDVCCILHNMFERSRMIRGSYLRTSEDMAGDFTTITPDDIDGAIARYKQRVNGNSVSDKFLKKVKAVTSAMAHTDEASKNARQKMFSMMSVFGLPAVLFTISPDDSLNFRIRIYAAHSSGLSSPPSCDDEIQKIQDFVVESSRVRTEYPGLCAYEFDNIMQITIEHLLGWDQSKNENKNNHGLFGNLDAFSYAVEEQGRKTLHAHMLLWVRNWNDLYKRIFNPEFREQAEEELKQYIDKVMSSNILGNKYRVGDVCVTDICINDKENTMEKPSLQDLRNMRTKNGECSFGGKAIIRCPNCTMSYTSEEIAINTLKKVFPQILRSGDEIAADELFLRPAATSKARMIMEMKIMHEMLPKKTNEKRKNSTEYSIDNKSRLLIAILRNHHVSCHCRTCFKKDTECRMKIPKPESLESHMMYNENLTNWYDWTGLNNPRNLFYLSSKRSLCDCFANTFNETASNIFGCNTNVVAGVDGGSAMYCTCYTFKSTQKEDDEHFDKACACMVRSVHSQVKEYENKRTTLPPEEYENIDRVTLGMKSLIGSVFMTTKSQKIAAPMCSYLVQNGSRFHFSHQFSYANITHYLNPTISDLQLDSDKDGNIIFKSVVANYLLRPKELETVCLYDFLSDFNVSSPNQNSMEWISVHPSKNHLKVCRNSKLKKIPLVNYLDFVDTKTFDGYSILTDNITEPPLVRHVMMEKYAQTASICFVPFRHIDDLKDDNGNFLFHFRSAVNDKIVTTVHLNILNNIQNCRNSLNAGRPKDYLEKRTDTPDITEVGDDEEKVNKNKEEYSEAFEAFLAATTNDNETPIQEPLTFRNGTNHLSFLSINTRCHGTHQCGRKGIVIPEIDESANDCVINGANVSTATADNDTVVRCDKVTFKSLYDLSIKSTERATRGTEISVIPTGTLQNIREYAEEAFRDDDDQKMAFEVIMASFVLQLHKEAQKFESSEGELDNPRKRRRFNKIRETLEKVNRDSQLIAFLSGAGGSGKSHVINMCVQYAKSLCKQLGVTYDKRTITVTAMTGAAAVSIKGETTHKAAALKRKVTQDEIDEYRYTYLFIVDEVSFASKPELTKLHEKLNEIREMAWARFGNIPIVFAGDFFQLSPVRLNPIFLFKDFDLWYEWVHTFLELKTNHRFKNDKNWGNLLLRYRDQGPTIDDVNKINSRVIGSKNGPTYDDIPEDVVYATSTNKDRMAINDGIFAKHLENTHSKNPNDIPPFHTICIKAGDLSFKRNGSHNTYDLMNSKCKDIIYATCGEAHIENVTEHKNHDPMLKLYHGRPLMINENQDVKNCIANGAMCSFYAVELSDGITRNDLEKIVIDGYYVWCAHVTQIKSIKVKMIDGVDDKDDDVFVSLEACTKTALCKFPLSMDGTINKNTLRLRRRIKLKQFPVVCANARTVHKLQGRSIVHLLISGFSYVGNWVYVALSRVRTIKGLFLRIPLDHSKCRGMSPECLEFHQLFRDTKSPLPRVELHNSDI